MSISTHHDSLALPSTPLADRASELIAQTLPPFLYNHSVRGFLFGRAAAAQQGLHPGTDYDEEVAYLISALHDIGLAEIANGAQRFELDGADYAARFLEENGMTDGRVDTVWDAIAAHTSGFSDTPVYRRRRPAEIWVAVDGIGIDVGGGPGHLPPGYAERVLAAYPRLGGNASLTESIAAQALADPRKAALGTLAREILRCKHPELPDLTWDTLIGSNGWQD